MFGNRRFIFRKTVDIYSYDLVRFTCIGISSLIRKSVFDIDYYPLLIPMHIKVPNHNCIYNRLPEDEPSGSKHVEDIKNLKN